MARPPQLTDEGKALWKIGKIFLLMLLGILLSLAVRRAEEWIAPWKTMEE